MASSPEFVRTMTTRLVAYDSTETEAMFGGFGIFVDDLLIGLIVDDVLYLKADDGNRPDFEAAAMGAFTYHRRGRPFAMSYWQVPAAVFDNPVALAGWAKKAHLATRNGKRTKSALRARCRKM